MLKFSFLLIASAVAVPAIAAPMTPTEYVMTAGASDLFERTSSELVLQSTQNSDVRSFAQMMIAHHSQSTVDVKTAARQSRVRPAPSRLTPLQVEMIAQLRAEGAASRDALYIAQQKAAHNGALNVQKGYATEGTAPALRDAAGKVVPVVEQHIAMLMKM